MGSPISRRLWATGWARFRPLITLAVCYVALGFVLRVGLWIAFGRAQHVSGLSFSWILAAGVVADAVESLYLLAPFATLLWLMPDEIWWSSVARSLLLTGALLWLSMLTFVATAEY